MAFLTFYTDVLACDGISGLGVVVKEALGLPIMTLIRMAYGTAIEHAHLLGFTPSEKMHILMTGYAVLTEPLENELLQRKGLHLLNVTILALKLCVLTSQWVLGYGVIKMLDLPVFLGMTLGTIPPFEPGAQFTGMLVLVAG